MHEQHKIERDLKAEADRLSSKYQGAPVVVIVGGSGSAIPRTMTASVGAKRLRDLLGLLESSKQIESLKHFGVIKPGPRTDRA